MHFAEQGSCRSQSSPCRYNKASRLTFANSKGPSKKRNYDGTIAWLQEDPQQWLHRGTHLPDVSLMQMDRCASSAEMGAAVVELRLGHNVWTKRGKTWSILMALP